MKIRDILEQIDIDVIFKQVLNHGISTKDLEIQDWWINHVHLENNRRTYDRNDLTVKDGKMYYRGNVLRIDCDELKYPIGYVKMLRFEDSHLRSTNNFPDKPGIVDTISAGGQKLTKIDHPIVCKRLSLALNEIESVKNIHKLVKCEELVVWNNPIKEGVLDLLKIPGIKVIDDGKHADLLPHYSKSNKAIAIVSKYADKGPSGIVKAQRELLENDLEDYE